MKPIPLHLRFHDLRHTTATLLLKEGVSLAVVSKLPRHSDPAITPGTYGHLDVEDLRQAVDRLPFGTATPGSASTDGLSRAPERSPASSKNH